MALRKYVVTVFTLGAVLLGCAPSQGPEASQASRGGPGGPVTVKRIIAAISDFPRALSHQADPASGFRGVDELHELLNASLSNTNDQGELRPQLAEAVPTLENGLWKLFPDGKMETTWRIRPGVQWHDGASFTSDDLLFTLAVSRDEEIDAFSSPLFDLIEAVSAPDSRTLTIRWKGISIEADTAFTFRTTPPIPKHLLDKTYREDKANLRLLPYWTEEFVGTGPFRLTEWDASSHLILQANDSYVLGRPGIDVIEVRFIPDANTMVANILAGEIELTLGRGISLEQALPVRDRWRDGWVDNAFVVWIVVHPQLLTPDPAIVGDARFRRALMHAIDRQEMADTIQLGMAPVAHSILSPAHQAYKLVEPRLPKYEYDPRKAQELIGALGYVRGADGGFVDNTGRRLSVEFRSIQSEINMKSMLTVSDYWRRVGVGVQEATLTPGQRSDRSYRATFTGFDVYRGPINERGIRAIHSSKVARQENNFLVTGNQARYVNREYDALLERHDSTIPVSQRNEVLGQIAYHLADQVVGLGLFFDAEPAMISNRLVNVAAKKAGEGTMAWNAEQWLLK